MKVLFFILWMACSFFATYFTFFMLNKKNTKKLLFLNQKYKEFQLYFILYFLISPLLFLCIIPAKIIIFIFNRLCGKDYFVGLIQDFIVKIANSKNIRFAKYRTTEDYEETYYEDGEKEVGEKILNKINRH